MRQFCRIVPQISTRFVNLLIFAFYYVKILKIIIIIIRRVGRGLRLRYKTPNRKRAKEIDLYVGTFFPAGYIGTRNSGSCGSFEIGLDNHGAEN